MILSFYRLRGGPEERLILYNKKLNGVILEINYFNFKTFQEFIMKNKFKIYLLFSLSFLFLWSACRKAEGPVMNYPIAAPDSLQLSTDQQTVIASWHYPSGQPVTHFIAELSVQEDFSHLIASDTLDAKARTVSFENSGYQNAYYFRILAQTENLARNTDFVSTSLILENNFLPLGQNDVTASSVVLKWNAPVGASVTSILLIPADSLAMAPIELSQSEIKQSTATIEDLKPLTTYTALLFSAETREGVVEFTTKDPNAKITINSGSKTYNTLADAIAAAGSGDVINVGGSYDFSSLGDMKIDKSLTIQGIPNVEKPTIRCGEFNLTGNVGTFKLYRLKLIGSNNQTISLTDVTGTANVIIDSCDISGPTAGLIYASSDATAATYSLTVNNSLLHDFGNEGGDFIDFRGGTLTDIELKNSTFWNLARRFLRIDEDVTYTGNNNSGGQQYAGKDSGDPPTIDHCTLNNIASQSFIRIQIPTNNFVMHVNNSILTNDKSTGNEFGFEVNGYANDNNTFGTNQDGFFAGWGYWNHLTFSPTTNIKNLDPQYKDAAHGDFTVGNSTLKALGWGDPRWLQ